MIETHENGTDTVQRKDGWTLWREIYGTVLGTLPFIFILVAAWNSMSERVRVNEVHIETARATFALELANVKNMLELRDRQGEREREQTLRVLERISGQIEVLQKQRRD